MIRHQHISHQLARPVALAILWVCISVVCFPVSQVHAREISIAFIDDGLGEPTPRLSTLIVQELEPLLGSGNTLAPVFLGTEDIIPNVLSLLAQATIDPKIEYIVATGFRGSQEIYKETRFSKPTYLLRVFDPKLTGAKPRDNVRNLRSYSTVNEIVDVFERVNTLFGAKRIGILLPKAFIDVKGSFGGAIASAAKKAGIDAQFLAVDLRSDVASQLPELDAVILPPISNSKQERSALLSALQRRKIPSFAVGGDSMVRSGALISDTLDEDERVLARRVALDLQQGISRNAPTQGMQLLKPKKRTTINMDTARALGIDFTLDEILTARVVQGNSKASALGFLTSVELAIDRNLGLRGQRQQLRIDQESLEQARSARLPQLTAQLANTHRSEPSPTEQDTLAGVKLRQTLYSPSSNTAVDVAKLGIEASEKSLEQKLLDTVQQTASAYFLALQNQAQVESSLRDLALNRENLILAEQRKRSGSGAGVDIYRWQAVIAASESAVLRAFAANTSAQSQLAQLLNMRMLIPTTLVDIDVDQPPFDLLHKGLEPHLKSTRQAELLREASAARALAHSPQLERASANVAINDTRLKATRRSYYTPELSLNAQYSYYIDSSENAAGIELDDDDSWSLSLTAELPLWDSGTRRSLIHQYAAQSALADSELQSLRMALWANSGVAVNNLIANYRAIGLSDQAKEAALKSQQITQRAYRLGSASVTELLDTQNEYRQAIDNAQIARYQYLATLVDFQALMGEMPMLKSAAEQQLWLQTFKQSMSGATQ